MPKNNVQLTSEPVRMPTIPNAVLLHPRKIFISSLFKSFFEISEKHLNLGNRFFQEGF